MSPMGVHARVLAGLGIVWSLADAALPAEIAGPGGVKDIPEALYAPVHPPRRPPLARTHDLFRLATRGEGRFSLGASDLDAIPLRPGLVLSPLSWRLPREAARRARLLRFWAPTNTGDEVLLTLTLQPGESWCSPELVTGRDARLRLEPVSVSRAGEGRLALFQHRGGHATPLRSEAAPGPALLSAASQWDMALEPGPGIVCFTALDHAVAVGKPRILEPEDPAADHRPRWIVLTIMDALRADVLTGEDADRACPTLVGLSGRGMRFDRAISPGCHTRAAVSSILMGRDATRIDPLLRLLFQVGGGSQAPPAALYSRGNLQLGELAESAGYLSLFLGNNRFLSSSEAFARASIQGAQDSGTLDTVARLPALLERYAEERVLLVYYISTPHGLSVAPRRLFDSFGCGAKAGVEAARCTYLARVRHADEGLAALLAGLEDHGLGSSVLHVVTADHGERFFDGEPKLVVHFGRFRGRTDEKHGTGCGEGEVRVPLVVSGLGVPVGKHAPPVSTLDVFPTALRILGVRPVSRLDGEPLPLAGPGPASPPRDFVSYGFCADSLIEGKRQLLRWRADCVLEDLEGRRVTHGSELWEGSRRLGTDTSAPERLAPGLARLRGWIGSRVPGPALILDPSRLPSARLTVTALEGRIVDYGPSGTPDVAGIQDVRALADARSLSLDFDGYRGLFFVATDPPDASVSVEVHPAGAPATVPLFLGPLQLPLAIADRPLHPRRDAALVFAREEPRAAPGAGLRLWWQPYRPPEEAASREFLNEINRVLREWGYVR
jgi:hypothetical protein